MITLYSFGPMFGLPDASPFVTKAEVLLKMSGLPFTTDLKGFNKAPKGKLPYIRDKGRLIADSTLIRLHLENEHSIDFDKGLSPRHRGVAWAMEKLCEDHLYWIVLNDRWLDATNFEKGPARFFDGVPAPVRSLVKRLVRSKLRKALHAQGTGRHSLDEMNQLGERAVQALATTLGDQPYLMGHARCGADATVFAFMMGLLCPHFESPLRTTSERHENLVAYCERMKRELYPELTA